MKSDDHVRITEAATNLYHSTFQNKVSKLLFNHCSLLSQGAKEADSKPIFVRATNWHFFNRNLTENVIEKAIWENHEPTLFHLSSDHILNKRDEQLDDEIKKLCITESCVLVGRILHHIQDMSTPSHVVPVYHGVFIKDSYEKYLNKKFLNDTDRLLPIMQEIVDENILNDLPKKKSITDLYTYAAENMLEYLKPENSKFEVAVDGVKTELPWTYFWEPKKVKHAGSYEPDCKFAGFGNFGPLGKHFGDTEEFERRNVRYKFSSRKVFDDLCRDITKKMIIDSVMTLHSLEERLMPFVADN